MVVCVCVVNRDHGTWPDSVSLPFSDFVSVPSDSSPVYTHTV